MTVYAMSHMYIKRPQNLSGGLDNSYRYSVFLSTRSVEISGVSASLNGAVVVEQVRFVLVYIFCMIFLL